MRPARRLVGALDGGHEIRLQVGDEVPELLDPVLHRRTGEEQHALRSFGPNSDRLGATGPRSLDVVGLIDDKHGYGEIGRDSEGTQRVEGRHTDVAELDPPI